MRILYIAARAPYSNDTAQELLDALLVSAAFGAEVSVLFQDEGVWQLHSGQDGSLLGRPSLGAQLQALPLYDVEQLYVDADSLHARGLASADLLLPVDLLQGAQLAALLAACDQVIRL